MDANLAGQFCLAIAMKTFPDDATKMSTLCVDWLASIDNATSAGSHKYVPTKELNVALGLPDGAGVYGYRRYPDGSYLLLTCSNGLACWSGKTEDEPKYVI